MNYNKNINYKESFALGKPNQNSMSISAPFVATNINNKNKKMKDIIKKTYIISIWGCDDDNVFEYDLTDEEFEFLKKLSEKSIQESKTQCQPILQIPGE
jgi:hypothetical protein